MRRFAIAFAGIGGFVLSATLYLLLARGNATMLLLAVVPGALGAAAVESATRTGRPRRQTSLTIIGRSVLAAIACPFVTAAAMVVLGALTHDLPASAGGEILFSACLGSGIAGFFAAPLGAVFGVVYALVWQRLEATRGAGRSALEQLWMLFGVAFVTLGAVDLVLAQVVDATRSLSPSQHDMLVPLGLGALVFGVLTTLRGSVMASRRRRILRAVARGSVPGYALAPARLIEGAEGLPDLFGRGAGQVLVRRMAGREGPYRATELVEPLARL